MNMELVKSALLWSTLINYSILILWFALLLVARDWFYLQQSRWFPQTKEDFARSNYLMFGLYKLATIVFNLVPWMALKIVT